MNNIRKLEKIFNDIYNLNHEYIKYLSFSIKYNLATFSKSKDILSKLSFIEDHSILCNIAENKYTPLSVLNRLLLLLNDTDIVESIINNKNSKLDKTFVFEFVLDKNEYFYNYILYYYKKTPVEILKKLYIKNKLNIEQLNCLLLNDNLPKEIVEEIYLNNKTNISILRNIASHNNCTLKILKELLSINDCSLYNHILLNNKTNSKMIEQIYNSYNTHSSDVIYQFLDNKNTPDFIILSLYNKFKDDIIKEPNILNEMIEHPNCPDYLKVLNK